MVLLVTHHHVKRRANRWAHDARLTQRVRWQLNTDTAIVSGMTWFHFTKQEQLKRNRELRRGIAETAKKHAAENIFLLPHDITPALTAAMDEERTFEEYFREKMPSHLRQALDLEISFWQHLKETIAAVH